jgi:hypothetical protein
MIQLEVFPKVDRIPQRSRVLGKSRSHGGLILGSALPSNRAELFCALEAKHGGQPVRVEKRV